MSADEVGSLLGPCWVPARRFGVRQGGKVRVVDDCSEFLVNAAVETTEKIDLGGVDELLCLAKAWLR
eukprot:2752029-Alexandrium_andersonii.AAC.1